MKHKIILLTALTALTLSTACRQDMHDQPRFTALQHSGSFEDLRASRPVVEGAVARGELREDAHLYAGYVDGQLVAAFPFEITRERLERGRERFDIYCSPCHGRIGDGNGAVVQRGFQRPPSYHSDRLRQAPVGHFYDVMTNGFGRMYSFNDRVKVEDRWAIAAYIRALQLSQNVGIDELSEPVVAELRAEGIQ